MPNIILIRLRLHLDHVNCFCHFFRSSCRLGGWYLPHMLLMLRPYSKIDVKTLFKNRWCSFFEDSQLKAQLTYQHMFCHQLVCIHQRMRNCNHPEDWCKCLQDTHYLQHTRQYLKWKKIESYTCSFFIVKFSLRYLRNGMVCRVYGEWQEVFETKIGLNQRWVWIAHISLLSHFELNLFQFLKNTLKS